MSFMEKSIVITLGDPLSINIYAVCSMLQEFKLKLNEKIPLVIIGSAWAYHEQSLALDCQIMVPYTFIDIVPKEWGKKTTRSLTPFERGTIASLSLKAAIDYPGEKVLITSPVDKKCMYACGFGFPGQTEFFAHHAKRPTLMMMATKYPRSLFVGLCTNHVPLSEVSSLLNVELIVQKYELMVEGIKKITNHSNPKIAVCGLNPHCSDGDQFGHEETNIICSAIAQLISKGHQVSPYPVSADTVFHQAYQGSYDGVLAMYHDQGLIPIKTMSFAHCVNLTINGPCFRVSPDHGPVSDKYLSKEKDIELGSFRASFEFAIDAISR